MAYLQKWIAVEPDNAQAHSELGYAYLALKNREMVLKEYETLTKLDPELAAELKWALENP